jgi:hypothetical protein
MKEPSLNQIKRSLKDLDYPILTKPFQLNIIGIRSADALPNKFDDLIAVFYTDDKGNEIYKTYPATTDTGTYWLKNPMSNMGSAAMKAGIYKDAYAIGNHRGYTALTQVKPVTVYRDLDRNAVFDFGTKTSTGVYGINIHKAGADSQNVDKWSAGCQVFQKSKDFDEVMQLAHKHKSLHGNAFTYILLDERADLKKKRRFLLYLLIAVGSFSGWTLLRTMNNKPIIPKF